MADCAVLDFVERTPVGRVAAVSRGAVLLAVEIVSRSDRDVARRMRKRFGEVVLGSSEAGRQLREYFAGRRRAFTLRSSIGRLGAFQGRVLAACAKIPFGRTITYGQIAALAGSPRAARAAGAALGRNPCLVVIPCHRVTAAGGSLGGFSAPGGLSAKRALLELEGAAKRRETSPKSEVRSPKRAGRKLCPA